MLAALIISGILTLLLIPATLAWWRIADHWADNEHKRFKDSAPAPRKRPRVIARSADQANTPAGPTTSESQAD